MSFAFRLVSPPWRDALMSLGFLGLLGCSPETGAMGSGGAAGRAGVGAGGASGGGGRVSNTGGAGSAAGSTPVSGAGGGSAGDGVSGGGANHGGAAGRASTGGTGGLVSASGAMNDGGRGGASGGSESGGASGSGGVASGGASGNAGAAPGGAGNVVDAAAMVKAMGFGTNIGNTLENTTSWETGWGQPLISKAYIDGVASHGFKTVRVPVAWDTYAVNGVVDSTKMDRVKEVVGWIEAAGMYSIVNIHWDGGWIDNDTEGNPNRYKLTSDVTTKFSSYWTQIATAFSSIGHKLIFEALNEESKFYVNGDTNQGPDYAPLNTLNQLFVTTVRGQGGYNATRALLIAGFTTDIDLTCVDAFKIPSDPAGAGKLFLSLHYYTPYTFCGLDTVESWGSPQTTWGTSAEKATLEMLFDRLGSYSTQKGVPVILGEFAVTRGESYPRDPASRTLWMQSVADSSFSRGIVPVLWDTGSEISRTDGALSSELQSVMNGLEP